MASIESAAPARASSTIDVSDPLERRRRLAAIGLMCGALVCFACLDTTGKWLGRQDIPVPEIVWARYLGATLLSLAFMNPFRAPGGLRTRRPVLQAFRALLLFGNTACNFMALRYLQLDETMAITFAMPLVVSLLAGPILGEWIGLRRLAAILVGFVGVLVVVRPGMGGMHWAVVYSVASLLCYALYAVLTRLLAPTETSASLAFFGSSAGAVILTPFLGWFWQWPTHMGQWLALAALGLFGGLGHFLLILAHGRAPAAALAPFVYTQIVWMVALGWLIFGHTPGPWTLAGGAVVIGSGLYLFACERNSGRGGWSVIRSNGII